VVILLVAPLTCSWDAVMLAANSTGSSSSTAPDRRPTVRDLRCLLGLHRWRKKQIEDSQYVTCRRCGKDRTIYVQGMPFG